MTKWFSRWKEHQPVLFYHSAPSVSWQKTNLHFLSIQMHGSHQLLCTNHVTAPPWIPVGVHDDQDVECTVELRLIGLCTCALSLWELFYKMSDGGVESEPCCTYSRLYR